MRAQVSGKRRLGLVGAGLSVLMGLAVLVGLAGLMGSAPLAAADDGSDRQGKPSGFKHGDWPFRPPERPAVPAPAGAEGVANPVDAFVVEKLEGSGLGLSPRADRATLIRRLTYDLTGLPPTPRERAAFLADDSPAAYERLVDRLLASPAFGERWAQHWLDVVRYAETEGFKADSLRPNAFRYRDYVIRSFNDDRPYDEFVRQQLAGDELDPYNPDALVATGLNRLYPDENNAANLFQRRQEILDDITEVTGLAFMGLTMGCARCHDHKFDDILQTDYYRLQAFFAPLVERDGLLAASREEREEYLRKQQAWEDATRDVRQEIDKLFEKERQKSFDYNLTKFRPAIKECVNMPPEKRTPLQEQVARIALKQLKWRFNPKSALKKLTEDERKRYGELDKELARFDSLKPKPLPEFMGVADVGRTAPLTHRLTAGNFKRPQEQVQPGFPVFLGASKLSAAVAPGVAPSSAASAETPSAETPSAETPSAETPSAETPSANTTGRRSSLARWLTRAEHPLTPRVMANRLWHHHLGRGIVGTPNDFGFQGEAPTHLALLDWLATEFVESGWSLKHLHRLIVTSSTYCQSSAVRPDDPHHARALEVDGENRFLWHARRRRLEGEAIRDTMLFVSGAMTHRLHGPSVRPKLPDGISKRYAWKPDGRQENHYRRSIYVFVKRNMRFPLFDTFDWPDLHNSCASRSHTTTPPQALLMLNSELTLDLARRWAEKLVARSGDEPRALVTAAYEAAFGRPPGADELELALAFLGRSGLGRSGGIAGAGASGGGELAVEAVHDLCHALFNASEFIYVD